MSILKSKKAKKYVLFTEKNIKKLLHFKKKCDIIYAICGKTYMVQDIVILFITTACVRFVIL